MVYLAVFGGIALFTALLTVVAVRVRRTGDAQSLALRASDVVAQTTDLLLGPGFLWAVWQKTADFSAMTMLIRNQRDEVVSTVVKPNVVLDNVLKRFDLDGTHYEIRKPRLMTNRTHLCVAGREEVLLSAEHKTFTTSGLVAGRSGGSSSDFGKTVRPASSRSPTDDARRSNRCSCW
jgi:hypothetical protein